MENSEVLIQDEIGMGIKTKGSHVESTKSLKQTLESQIDSFKKTLSKIASNEGKYSINAIRDLHKNLNLIDENFLKVLSRLNINNSDISSVIELLFKFIDQNLSYLKIFCRQAKLESRAKSVEEENFIISWFNLSIKLKNSYQSNLEASQCFVNLLNYCLTRCLQSFSVDMCINYEVPEIMNSPHSIVKSVISTIKIGRKLPKNFNFNMRHSTAKIMNLCLISVLETISKDSNISFILTLFKSSRAELLNAINYLLSLLESGDFKDQYFKLLYRMHGVISNAFNKILPKDSKLKTQVLYTILEGDLACLEVILNNSEIHHQNILSLIGSILNFIYDVEVNSESKDVLNTYLEQLGKVLLDLKNKNENESIQQLYLTEKASLAIFYKKLMVKEDLTFALKNLQTYEVSQGLLKIDEGLASGLNITNSMIFVKFCTQELQKSVVKQDKSSIKMSFALIEKIVNNLISNCKVSLITIYEDIKQHIDLSTHTYDCLFSEVTLLSSILMEIIKSINNCRIDINTNDGKLLKEMITQVYHLNNLGIQVIFKISSGSSHKIDHVLIFNSLLLSENYLSFVKIEQIVPEVDVLFKDMLSPVLTKFLEETKSFFAEKPLKVDLENKKIAGLLSRGNRILIKLLNIVINYKTNFSSESKISLANLTVKHGLCNCLLAFNDQFKDTSEIILKVMDMGATKISNSVQKAPDKIEILLVLVQKSVHKYVSLLEKSKYCIDPDEITQYFTTSIYEIIQK